MKRNRWAWVVVGAVLLTGSVGWAGETDVVVDPFAAVAAETATKNGPTARPMATESTNATTETVDAVTGAGTATEATLPWLRAVLAFCFVASLILIVATIARRLLAGRAGLPLRRPPSVRLVQTMSLGLKRDVIVVDFEDQRLLLGAMNGSLQVLHRVPVPTAPLAPAATTEFSRELRTAQAQTATATTAVDELRVGALQMDAAVHAAVTTIGTPEAPAERQLGEQIRSMVRNLRPFASRATGTGNPWTKQ